ncbi:hypothetical protein [uncultured Fibrella sp.]|uniref:hypothetical protein n=1 Tax=uncultured Fibrella sp. TaxID=1284596 RepID=UPI0035CA1DBC
MTYTFETWVSYPARAVNAEDGLRIEFSVPVHSDLQTAMKNPDKREILCKYRVRKGFLWGQLGRNARVKIEATLVDGARGGQHLHCSTVEILEGKPRTTKADPIARRMEKKLAKQAGISLADLRPQKPAKATASAPPAVALSTPQLSLF